MPESEAEEYINMRIPRTEYEKIKEVREQLKKKSDYSWAGSLALGAFVGLMAGIIITEVLNDDDKPKKSRR